MFVSRNMSVAERSAPSRTLVTLLRAGVSVAALAFVFTRIPLRDVAASARGLDPLWTLGAFATVYGAIVLSAAKWQVLLRARDNSLSLLRLTRHYLVGLFFNNFLPTSVGGDVVRAWDAGRDLNDAPEGAASVIAERLIASLGLGLTAAIGLPFVNAGPQATVAVLIVVVASAGLAALFLVPVRAEAMVRRTMGARFEGVSDWVARTVHGVNAVLRNPRAVASVLALSVAFQALVAFVNHCIFQALGTPVGMAECVVFTSIASAVTMVPVSIAGHGVREAAYAYFFGLAGVAHGVAVAGSLLFFVVVALSTAPGAVLFAVNRPRR